MIKDELYLIKWLDATGVESDWRELHQDQQHLHIITSVGMITKVTDDLVEITPHYVSTFDNAICANEVGCGQMSIPRVSIKEIHNIELERCKTDGKETKAAN